jgi:outer membrane beta-barrel protein
MKSVVEFAVLGAAVLVMAAGAGGARAAENDADMIGSAPVFQPRVERRVIDEAAIRARDFEVGIFGGLISIEDFGSSALIGGSLGYHMTEDFFVEAVYGTAKAGKTSFERLAGDVQLLSDSERQYRSYDLSLGYSLLPGESFIGARHAFASDMYLIGGIGATQFAGDRRFTWNFGAGYRLVLTDWLALRADVRDHVFANDITGTDKTTHNIDMRVGITSFF